MKRCWILSKFIFCICWDDHVVFVLASVCVLYYIYGLFMYVESFLHPWNETNLVMEYGLFDVLLDSVCQCFVKNLCIEEMQLFCLSLFHGWGLCLSQPTGLWSKSYWSESCCNHSRGIWWWSFLNPYLETCWLLQTRKPSEIQNGNWDSDADSVSSVNQGPYWDAGATLGGGEAPGRVETLAPWTPSLWKSSPCHNTLRKQAGCHPHAATNASHQLPATSSKHAWETFSRPNRWEPSISRYPSATSGIKQHNPPGQTDPHLQKNWINKGNEN
jgi:hypothetical protein